MATRPGAAHRPDLRALRRPAARPDRRVAVPPIRADGPRREPVRTRRQRRQGTALGPRQGDRVVPPRGRHAPDERGLPVRGGGRGRQHEPRGGPLFPPRCPRCRRGGDLRHAHPRARPPRDHLRAARQAGLRGGTARRGARPAFRQLRRSSAQPGPGPLRADRRPARRPGPDRDPRALRQRPRLGRCRTDPDGPLRPRRRAHPPRCAAPCVVGASADIRSTSGRRSGHRCRSAASGAATRGRAARRSSRRAPRPNSVCGSSPIRTRARWSGSCAAIWTGRCRRPSATHSAS